MRRYVLLAAVAVIAVVLVAGLVRLLVFSINYPATASSPLMLWQEGGIGVATPDPTNLSIWSDTPMLDELPEQEYSGRVVIEIWDEGELSSNTSYPHEQSKTIFLLEQARLALQDPDTPIITKTSWSNEPALQPGVSPPGQLLLGRVVVEVWDHHTAVAITGSGPIPVLVQRAIQRLRQVEMAIARTSTFSTPTPLPQ